MGYFEDIVACILGYFAFQVLLTGLRAIFTTAAISGAISPLVSSQEVP